MEQQVQDTQARAARPVRMISAKVALAGAVVIAVLATGITAMAGVAAFPDVPADHVFATEIHNLAAAGITGGFADGNFRPGQDVTRQAMAAFLGRGLSRASYREFNAIEITGDVTTMNLPTLDIEPGAALANTNGYVLVTATIELDRNSDTCPCSAYLDIQSSHTNFSSIDFIGDSMNFDVPATSTFASQTVTAIVEAEAGSTLSLRVQAHTNVTTLHASDRSTWAGNISAVYVPYGWDGTDDHEPAS